MLEGSKAIEREAKYAPGLSDQQQAVLDKNPKSRLIREKNERVRYFSEQFATEAAKKYASTARELAEDYKRQALDQAVVEMYCGGSRFAEKNKNLVERSKASPDWLTLKERHKRRIQS